MVGSFKSWYFGDAFAGIFINGYVVLVGKLIQRYRMYRCVLHYADSDHRRENLLHYVRNNRLFL